MNLKTLTQRIKRKMGSFAAEEVETDRIPSAVIIPIVEIDGEPYLMFMRKTEDGSPHSGQVSFPGGCKEKRDKTMLETALREFEEETGISRENLEIIASLEPVPTRSTPFIIYPFIGILKGTVNPKPDKKEVARIFFVPFEFLFKSHPFCYRNYTYRGLVFRTPLIEYDGETIWGATARILELFFDKLKEP